MDRPMFLPGNAVEALQYLYIYQCDKPVKSNRAV
jgi:hypothetical protein